MRFSNDFMFHLNSEEWYVLRLQIETSKKGSRRYLPSAFTEQGVATFYVISTPPRFAQTCDRQACISNSVSLCFNLKRLSDF